MNKNKRLRSFFAMCSQKYNPENQLLYLEATHWSNDDIKCLEKIISNDGCLESQELWRIDNFQENKLERELRRIGFL